MATYNFHFREITPPQTGSGALRHWTLDFPIFAPTAISTYVYDVSGELFVLYPRRNNDEFTNKTPTNTATNLYEFRVASGIKATTPAELANNRYDLDFGNINVDVADTLLVNLRGPFSIFDPVYFTSNVQLQNSVWTNSNWTITNLTTFKNEIATFIAKCCDNSRLLTGIYTEPLSVYSDFAVQIYKDGAIGLLNNTLTIVVFYPGNDPEADEIITVTT
jgi:hypothetical protein